MNIATIAALAVTLGLPAPAQQSATKIITENGQPALALDEQFAARLRDGGMKQGSPATVPAEFSAAAPRPPPPCGCQPCRCQGNGGGTQPAHGMVEGCQIRHVHPLRPVFRIGRGMERQAGGSEWIQKNMEVDTDTYAAEALPLFKPGKA